MQKTKVAIVGMGTVGTGVARLLLDHGDRTARHAGRTLWLEKAVVRDLQKARDIDLPQNVLTDDVREVIDNPEISVVAHLVGGLEPARTIMLQLLEAARTSSPPTKPCSLNMDQSFSPWHENSDAPSRSKHP